MGIEQFERLSAWGLLTNMIKRDIGIFPYNGVIVNGASGTFARRAGPGSLLINYTTGQISINLGTRAVPLWNALGGSVPAGIAGVALSGGGLGSVGNAKMTYDFAVDGGAVANNIIPANSPVIPAAAIILGGTVDVTAACVGAGSISLGTSAGSSNVSLKIATVAATYAVNSQQPIIPLFTAATYLKLTAAGRLNLSITAGTITAGRFDVNVAYVIGN